MKLNRRLIAVCCFWTLCVWTLSGFAADKWYQIEILVFKQTSNTKTKERLPEGSILPSAASGIPVNATGDTSLTRGGSVAFRTLGESFFTLRQQYQKLLSAPRYSPILHLAWRQPIKYRKSGYKVWIQGGRLLPSTASNSNDPELNSSARQSNYEIFGLLRFNRARYLHVYTDLVYRTPANDGKSEFAHYRIKDHRRMSSRQIHYLDHPMFGMLIYIKPI